MDFLVLNTLKRILVVENISINKIKIKGLDILNDYIVEFTEIATFIEGTDKQNV